MGFMLTVRMSICLRGQSGSDTKTFRVVQSRRSSIKMTKVKLASACREIVISSFEQFEQLNSVLV